MHDDPTQLQICQAVSHQSHATIQGTLREFSQGEKKILLLIINMQASIDCMLQKSLRVIIVGVFFFFQETSDEMVNHLRVMVEEEEVQSSSRNKKLFVLVLHFPPAMFFDSCYPSLFLRGWNHYYLDSIGHCPTISSGHLVDIEQWLQRCCLPMQSKLL